MWRAYKLACMFAFPSIYVNWLKGLVHRSSDLSKEAYTEKKNSRTTKAKKKCIHKLKKKHRKTMSEKKIVMHTTAACVYSVHL